MRRLTEWAAVIFLAGVTIAWVAFLAFTAWGLLTEEVPRG